jgi:S-adenosylmethionine synthetase
MNDAVFEAVERKGLGHPDTMCDLLAERLSYDLGNFYLKNCGRVLHYNVDKSLLVGGVSQPKFGGGKIIEPARLYLGDRATSSIDGRELDLDSMIETSLSSWLQENLRFMRLGDNLKWKSEIRKGSASLSSVDDRGVSNDTSVGVGYWPLSDVERMTLAVEERINSPAFKKIHPETGEDVKVMSVRKGLQVDMTVACAMVDKFISDTADYVAKKELVKTDIKSFLETHFGKYRTAYLLT